MEKIWQSRIGHYDNIIRRMRITFWIPKATDAHSEYLKIKAFSATKIVTRTGFNVTLKVHCMSCLNIQIVARYLLAASCAREVPFNIPLSVPKSISTPKTNLEMMAYFF